MSNDTTTNEIQEQLTKLRPHPIDKEYQRPHQGGCWICRRGNGWEETNEFKFITEVNAFYHPPCLEKLNLQDEEELVQIIEERRR